MNHGRTTPAHRTDTQVAQEIIAEIERELETRIRPVVAHWPESKIKSLLREMAEVKYRYGGADSKRTPPR